MLYVISENAYDFASSLIPGWHTTIFPQDFFVNHFISSYVFFISILNIAIKIFKYEKQINKIWLEVLNAVIPLLGIIVFVSELAEGLKGILFQFENYSIINRAFGPYWWAFWLSMFTPNVLLPQLFWFKKIRSNIKMTIIITILINFGLWLQVLGIMG